MRRLRDWSVAAAVAVMVGFLATPTAYAAPTPAPASAATRWCADLANGNATIDLMGHSVMAGGWATPLSQMLNVEGLSVQIWTGAAIGGSMVSHYLPGGPYYGHTQFTANNPSLIVMGWELNEYGNQVPPATFKTNYQALITKVKQLSPTSSILLVHSPWNINPSKPIPQWGYADAINQLADENDLLLLRIEFAFDTADPMHLYSDGVHHTSAGLTMDAVIFNYTLRGYCLRG